MTSCLYITPNRRLASTLMREHDDVQAKAGKKVWPKLQAVPLNEWLIQLWQVQVRAGALPSPILLDAQQSAQIWQSIVEAEEATEHPYPSKQLATLLIQAFEWTQAWQLPLNDNLLYSEEVQRYQAWEAQYLEYCEAHALLDSAQLPDRLMACQSFELKNKIIFYGFDECPPVIEKLYAHLKQHAVDLTHAQPPKKEAQVFQAQFENTEDELLAMAQYVYDKHISDPNKSIACIVPNLQQSREAITQALRQIFQPNARYQGEDLNRDKINLSGGVSLSAYPMIDCALFCLRFLHTPQPVEKVKLWLNNPYLNQAVINFNARIESHKICQVLLNWRQAQLRFSDLIQLLRTSHSEAALVFSEGLHMMQTQYDALPKTLSANAWVHCVANLLEGTVFHPQNLDTFSSQLYSTWEVNLRKLISFEILKPKRSRVEWLTLLEQLVTEHAFQPKTAYANIQVLGVLEAAGLQFDSIWMLGLTANTWPAKPNPNPFLPFELQKEYQTPHADSTREYQFANTLLARFKISCDELICSYANAVQDVPQLPSPFIVDTPVYSEASALLSRARVSAQLPNATPTMLTEEDTHGVSLQNTQLPAGTQFLQAQAVCPFKAYVKYRLNIESQVKQVIGFTPQDRGIVIHDVLQHVWQQLKNQAELAAMETEDLNNLLHELTQKSLKKHVNFVLDNTQRLLLETEVGLIVRQLQAWCEQELLREPFSVLSVEENLAVEFSRLHFKLRIDRVDVTAYDQTYIVDYKTGQSAIQAWFDARGIAPQLPFYALTYSHPISGLVFANIQMNKMRWQGVADGDHDAPLLEDIHALSGEYVQDTWKNQLEFWQHDITQLCEEIKSGVATITPKDQTLSCQFCDYNTLCRRHEWEGERC